MNKNNANKEPYPGELGLTENELTENEPRTDTRVANRRQVGGDHYQKNTVRCPHCGGELQHWDVYKFFPYLVGTLTKYLWRWRDKNGLQDLEKAGHYFEKQLEVARLEDERTAAAAAATEKAG